MFVDDVLFIAFPYAAVVLAVVVSLYRYFTDRFSYSSFSSQFLEGRALFWGSVPWHYGILIILLAHLVAFLWPGGWANLIASPTRLWVLEMIGLALALSALLGLSLLTLRRLRSARILAVTSPMDWVLLAALLTQVALGFWVALFFRWGSDWSHYIINWPAHSRTVFWSADFQSQLNTEGPIQECWMRDDGHQEEVIARAEYCGFQTRVEDGWLVIHR